MSARGSDDGWIWRFGGAPDEPARLRLFCFPFAGGAAQAFRDWPRALPGWVDTCAVQLPGRWTRRHEPPFRQMEALADAAAAALRPRLELPFALLGHSMGAVLAYEVARRLTGAGRPPAGLLVSGCQAPHLPHPWSRLHRLPDDELVAEMSRSRGAIPAEVMAEPEMLALFLPVLRADVEALETYRHRQGPPLSCPVTAYGGRDDPTVTRDQLEAWREVTDGRFGLRIFPGQHFYINTARELFLAALLQQLSELGC